MIYWHKRRGYILADLFVLFRYWGSLNKAALIYWVYA
jgi:hypothetical protein